LKIGGLMHLLGGGLDGTPFDIHRSQTWAALRSKYPTQMGHESLRGPTIDATETLLDSIKSKLEDAVGLTLSKSHKEFSDYLVHAVDRYHQNEQRVQEQGGECCGFNQYITHCERVRRRPKCG